MRVLAVTPIHVDAMELARRQARYDRLAGPGMRVELHDLGEGSSVPRALDSADDIAASEDAVLRWFATAHLDSFDALVPDCVLDPGVGTPAGDGLALPLHGIARLTAHWLAGLGHRVGAVARNDAIAAELDRKVASYGLPLEEPTAVLGLAVHDIADDATWAQATRRVTTDLTVDAVINACSAVEIDPTAPGPLLVDPTAAALAMLRLAGERTEEEA